MQVSIRNELVAHHRANNLPHIASSLSCIEILIAIGKEMKKGDRFILSKGHAQAALFSVWKHLKLPKPKTPSCSLGNGLSIGCGMAIAGHRTFVLMSDGEMQEGMVWEALMFAGYHRLNIIGIIDYNGFQAMGRIKDILGIEPLAKKFRSFRWETEEVDGHNIQALTKLFRLPKPLMIIAHTIKGKGVSYMENSNTYHYKPPR